MFAPNREDRTEFFSDLCEDIGRDPGRETQKTGEDRL